MSVYKTSAVNFTEQKMMTETQFVATMILKNKTKQRTCNVSLSVNHNNGSAPSKLC